MAGGAKSGHGLGVALGALATTHSELRSTSTVAVGTELFVGGDVGVSGCEARGAGGWRLRSRIASATKITATTTIAAVSNEGLTRLRRALDVR